MQIHVVRRGETLYLISVRYGVSVDQVVAANSLPDPSRLVVGQALVIPIPSKEPTVKPVIETNGYLTDVGPRGQQIVRELGKYLTYVSTFSYRVTESGDLIPMEDSALIEVMRANRVTPMLTITNFANGSFSSDIAHSVLSSTDVQEKLISNVLNVMREKGYRALNIDFEYVYPSDRELYNRFLRRITDRLHAAGYLVSTAVAPKTSGEQTGRLYEAHDYPAHGQIVDFVILMTYEWGWIGGPPMAIAPLNEVRRVLDYAVTVIPREKIMMGMPLYAYDWKLPYVEGTLADLIDPQEAVLRAIRYNAQIEYDPTAQSPFIRYYDEQRNEHIIWFEDARSVQAKYDTVKEYGLRGVSHWELTSAFPQNWTVLSYNFRIRKLAQAV